jgi:hypothetical protein
MSNLHLVAQPSSVQCNVASVEVLPLPFNATIVLKWLIVLIMNGLVSVLPPLCPMQICHYLHSGISHHCMLGFGMQSKTLLSLLDLREARDVPGANLSLMYVQL